jgi:hypothetical protein
MANAGRLAGLAALAGAAYMMSKNKDKETTDSNPTRGSGRDSTETRLKTPSESIAESDKSDKSSSISTKGESGTTTPGPDKSAPDLSESRNKPSAPKKPASTSKPAASTSDSRTLEAGMSRGTRSAEAKNPNYSNEGRSSTAPAKSASTSSSSEEGMRNYKPRSTPSSTASTVKNAVSDAAKTVAKTAIQGPAGALATAAKPVADRAIAATGYKVPTSEEAAANRQAAYDKVKSVGSSVVDYVKNFETPAERRAREAKNPPPKTSSTRDYNEDALSSGSAMRRGGAVKKMASGGMTASRRADGIATKGKTRCRMY